MLKIILIADTMTHGTQCGTVVIWTVDIVMVACNCFSSLKISIMRADNVPKLLVLHDPAIEPFIKHFFVSLRRQLFNFLCVDIEFICGLLVVTQWDLWSGEWCLCHWWPCCSGQHMSTTNISRVHLTLPSQTLKWLC